MVFLCMPAVCGVLTTFLRLVKWSSPHEADASDLAGLDRGRDHGLLSRRRGLGRRG